MKSLVYIGFFIFFLPLSLSGEELLLDTPLAVTVSPALLSPSIGFGSGLTRADDGAFYGVTDKGPLVAADCKEAKECGDEYYGLPSFSPGVVRFKREGDGFYAEKFLPLFERKKKKGIVRASGIRKGCKQYASSLRVDPEGVTVGPDGALWIVEEYGPSLLKVERETGEILARYTPGDGLPKILKHTSRGRGLEGIASSPDGSLWFVSQAILDIEGKTERKASFIRIHQFLPNKETAKSYAYSLDHVEPALRPEVKLSALEVLSPTTLFVLERTTRDEGEMYRIAQLSSEGIEPLPKQKKKKNEFEFGKDKKQLKKSTLKEISQWNIRFSGEVQKLEGMAFDRRKSNLYLSVDNDFGVSESEPCGALSAINLTFEIPLQPTL